MLPLILACAVPAASAALMFLLKSRTSRFTLLLSTTIAHFALALSLWTRRDAPSGALLGIDPAGLLFLTLISLLYCLVAVHLVAYTKNDVRGAPPMFLACHLASLSAMSVATLSTHWGLFWVAMEATTLATGPLLFYHHGPRALEATWKYIILCSVGIALALLGTFFLAMSAAGLTDLQNPLAFHTLIANAHRLSTPWLKMAAVFLLVGYGTKMGLAPMHTWKPDAYGEAPPPVAALLSGGLTNCAFLGVLRVTQVCGAAGESRFMQSMLVVFGLASLSISAACIIGQANYRRMLAYSSVEHMGILALAIGIGGLATFGGLLHAVNNALNKGILFLAAGNILQSRRTSEAASVTGLFKTLPVSAAFLVVGFLAATGMPPFGTFVSEFTILRGMIAEGGVVVPLLYLVFLAIVFIGMGSIVLEMVQGVPQNAGEGDPPRRESVAAVLPIAVFCAIVLLLGIHIPSALRDLLERAASMEGAVR
jgi:hydrogenase-4 component F